MMVQFLEKEWAAALNTGKLCIGEASPGVVRLSN